MNKTISVNIAGFVFNIEEGAYELLNQYLDSIRRNFQNEPDCDEIMSDIESRIAELFQDELNDRKEVIVNNDVDKVISIMGKPEDYVAEETADNFKTQSEPNADDFADAYADAQMDNDEPSFNHPGGRRRLYRDEESGTIGGVCTGLGWFFGIDPVLIKIGFILLTILGGSGILVYIILWIVIPEAKTTAEKLEMRGEPVNLDSIKEHVRGMKDSIDENTKDTSKKVKRAVDKGILAGSRLAASLSRIIGGLLIVGGIGALLVLIIILFGDAGLLPLVGTGQIEDLPTLLGILYPDGRSTLVFISIMLVTLIPIIAAVFLGVKLLFGIKGKYKKVSVIVGTIWFIGAGSLTLTGIELGMNFRNEAEIDYEVPVDVDSTGVLTVDVAEDDIFSNFIEYQQIWNYTELVQVENEQIHLGYPQLRIIEKENGDDFDVVMYKESHGKYTREAIHKAERIDYDIESSQNKLMLSPYFTINEKDKMRAQRLIVDIYVPEGKKVKFGENIDRILVDVSDEYYRHNQTFANTTWVVDKNGFRCYQCKDRRTYHPDYDEDDFD